MNKKLVRLHTYLLENNLEKEASALDYIIKYSGSPGEQPCFDTLENDTPGCSDDILNQTYSTELSDTQMGQTVRLKLDSVDIDNRGSSAEINANDPFDITLNLSSHEDSNINDICNVVVKPKLKTNLLKGIGNIIEKNGDTFEGFTEKSFSCEENKVSATYTLTPSEGAAGKTICICISEDEGSMVVKAGVIDGKPDEVASGGDAEDEPDALTGDNAMAPKVTENGHNNDQLPQASSVSHDKPVGIILSGPNPKVITKGIAGENFYTVSGSFKNLLRSGPDCGYDYDVTDLLNDFMLHSDRGYSQWYQMGEGQQFSRVNGDYLNHEIEFSNTDIRSGLCETIYCSTISEINIEIDICGCMDETACNYNDEATVDDASCEYNGDVCFFIVDNDCCCCGSCGSRAACGSCGSCGSCGD